MSTQYLVPKQFPGRPANNAIAAHTPGVQQTISNDIGAHIPGISKQPIHDNLPPYPGTDGRNLAREIKRVHVPKAQQAAEGLKTALRDAEEALLAVIDQHEVRTERHERLQAFAKTKNSRTIGGSFSSVGGVGR